MKQNDDYLILVVDDEEDLQEILRYNLVAEGYRVETAGSAEEAYALGLSRFDLVLLDVMMERESGFEMAERIRNEPETAFLPIIFLTARDTQEDIIAGLSLGADDYIVKPFSVQEMLLRVRSVLRRSYPAAEPSRNDSLIFGEITLDLKSKSLLLKGQNIPLTRTEFELLKVLLEQQGRVLSRDYLIERVWPEGVIVTLRSVDVIVTRLRKKLDTYADSLVTRPGFGYCFEP